MEVTKAINAKPVSQASGFSPTRLLTGESYDIVTLYVVWLHVAFQAVRGPPR